VILPGAPAAARGARRPLGDPKLGGERASSATTTGGEAAQRRDSRLDPSSPIWPLALRGAGKPASAHRTSWVEVIQQCFSGEVTEKALAAGSGSPTSRPTSSGSTPRTLASSRPAAELVDGNWLDRDGVADVNLLHSTWDNPWVALGRGARAQDEPDPAQREAPPLPGRRLPPLLPEDVLEAVEAEASRSPRLPIILTKTRRGLPLAARGRGTPAAGSGSRSPRAPPPSTSACRPSGPIFVTIEPAHDGRHDD